MNWRRLLFWRKKPVSRGNITDIVQKTLSNPDTQRKVADNVTRNNVLLEKIRGKIR